MDPANKKYTIRMNNFRKIFLYIMTDNKPI
jgi:hypothetical protein